MRTLIERLERSAALLTMRPETEPALATALSRMGLHLPRLGRFTYTDGLLLTRIEPYGVMAMRSEPSSSLMAELAPLGAIIRLAEQSDAGLGIRLSGLGVAKRLALLLPIDVHPERFGAGRCALVLVAHLNILVLRRGAEEFELYCDRSFAESFFRSIEAAMAVIAA